MSTTIDIKNIFGAVIVSSIITEDAISHEELMNSDYVQLSWNSDTGDTLPAGAYIMYGTEKYSLLEPYTPTRADEAEYQYTPQFQSRIMGWQKHPVPIYTYADDGTTVEAREFDWEFTGSPADAMYMVQQAIKNETGETWAVQLADSLPATISISSQSSSIFSVLNDIANQCKTEWWGDKTTNTLYLSQCKHGTAIPLSVGVNVKAPSVTPSKDGYFTRFYVFGSSRNVTQDISQGAATNSIINRRLTLDPSAYPGGYIDARPNLRPGEIFTTTLYYDDIYPSSKLAISDVRSRLKYRLDGKGNKIQTGADDEGNPVYEQYAIWYFQIAGFDFDPDTVIEGYDNASAAFESGQLAGRDFEVIYHSKAETVNDNASDVVPFNIKAGDFEIIMDESTGMTIPGMAYIIPQDGDQVILYNIEMPAEYTASARQELAETAQKDIAKRIADNNSYEFDSNPVDFYENSTDLTLGQAVTFSNGEMSLSTRVLMVEKHLDYPCQQRIRVGNEIIKGNTQQLREEVTQASQNIDILAAFNELSTSLQNTYGKYQREMAAWVARINGMWRFDPNDPTAIYSDYGVYSNSFISAKGKEDESGGTPTGATKLSELIDVSLSSPSDGQALVYDLATQKWVNKVIETGGIDEEELAAYLTENNYAKKSDIPSLDGYATEAWVTGKNYATVSDLDSRIDALVNGAPAAFDTLKEIADVLQGNVDSIGDILTALGNKVDKVAGKGLSSNDFTDALLTKLNGIEEGANKYVLPTATGSVLGGVKVGTTLAIASGVLNMKAVGTAGTYTKVTVDAYGRVTGHGSLAAGDIPALAISKITGLQDALDAKMDADDRADFLRFVDTVTTDSDTLYSAIGIRSFSGCYPDSLPVGMRWYNYGEAISFPVPNGMRFDMYANHHSSSSLSTYNRNGLMFRTGFHNNTLNGWRIILDGTNYNGYVTTLDNLTHAVASDYIQVGSARLRWDSATGALYVQKSDGTACGFYATGFVSTKGANDDAGSEVAGVTELSELEDVTISSPVNGQALVYRDGTWKNETIETGLDEAALAEYLTNNQYAKKSDIPSLSGYATQTWVNTQLGSYATTSAMNSALGNKADKSVTISAGTGLTGGGNLSANRTISLATVGTAGTYTKVTVDAYGRVTGHTSLAAGDIPNLPWSKITSGKPTTLAGYGITDGVNDVSVTGSGNVVSAAFISGHTLTLTKGVTAVATSRTVTAGSGLTGGGALSANITLNIVSANAGITVNADNIQLNTINVLTSTDTVKPLSAAQGKVIWDFITDLFEKVNIGTSSAPVWAIRAKYGLYTESFLSAKGANPDSGGTVVGVTALSELTDVSITPETLSNNDMLRWNGSKWVAVAMADITPDLSGYATQAWVTSQKYITTVSIATITDLHASWDALLKAAPTAYVTRWPTAAEVGALTQAAGDGRYLRKKLGVIGNNSNLNDYDDSGLYLISSASYSTIENFPTGSSYGYGILANFMLENGRGVQWYIPDHDFTMAVRTAWNVDAWQDWHYLLTNRNYTSYTVTRTGGGASGTWGIGITGNAATASKWATARTLTLTGAVTGSVSIDGSKNVSLATTFSYTNLDSRYVNVSGDTMTGSLTLATDASSAFNTKGLLFSGNVGRLGSSTNSLGLYSVGPIYIRPNCTTTTTSSYGLVISSESVATNMPIKFSNGGATINDNSGAGLVFTYAGTLANAVVLDSSSFRRAVGATSYTLGNTTYRWNNVYSVKGDFSAGLKSASNTYNEQLVIHRSSTSGSYLTFTNTSGQLGSIGILGAAATSYPGEPVFIKGTASDDPIKILLSTDNLDTFGWKRLTPYVYDEENGTRYYCHRLINLNPGAVGSKSSARIILKFRSSSDNNYPYYSEWKLFISLYASNANTNPLTSNVRLYTTIPGTETLTVYQTTDNYLWIKCDAVWNNIFQYKVEYYQNGNTTRALLTGDEILRTETTPSGTVKISGTDSFVWRNGVKTTAYSGVQKIEGDLNVSRGGTFESVTTDTLYTTDASNGANLRIAGPSIYQISPASGAWAGGFLARNSADDATIGYVAGSYVLNNNLQYLYYGGSGHNSPAMVILPNKNVGIGTTSPSYKLHVAGTGYFSSTLTVNGALTGNSTIYAKTGMYSDGYISAKGLNQSSDMRLKDVLSNIKISIKDIAKAPSIRFAWKDGGHIDVGSSAQYWKRVLPDAVKERDGYYEMAYGNIALVCAIALAKNAGNIEDRVTLLEKENKKLKKEIVELKKRARL